MTVQDHHRKLSHRRLISHTDKARYAQARMPRLLVGQRNPSNMILLIDLGEVLQLLIGKLGNRLGDFIEDAVRPAAVRLFQGRGIAVHEVQQNVTVQRGEEGLEIDLMVVNDSEAVAVECKSNLKIDDVNEHLDRLAKLKRLLPRYASFKVMGAVAAMVIPDNVARYAASKGLFVIGQSGEDMAIRNDEDFTPAVW